MKSHLRSIRISPKKLNIVADLVRGKAIRESLDLLQFTPKKGARLLANAIRSAAANAEHNEKVDPTTLFIQHIVVNKGPVLKRSRFGSRSRIKPLRKPTAHVSVTLAPQS